VTQCQKVEKKITFLERLSYEDIARCYELVLTTCDYQTLKSSLGSHMQKLGFMMK
jgi:hypothetical protein